MTMKRKHEYEQPFSRFIHNVCKSLGTLDKLDILFPVVKRIKQNLCSIKKIKVCTVSLQPTNLTTTE